MAIFKHNPSTKSVLISFLLTCFLTYGQEERVKIERLSSKKFILLQDSLAILTPYVEIKEKSNSRYSINLQRNAQLRSFVKEILLTQYLNSTYVEVPFLFNNPTIVNTAIEGEVIYKVQRAPSEILIDSRRNSIFFSIYGYYGDTNRTTINFFIIDNLKKKWKLFEHLNYDLSPLDLGKMKEQIIIILSKIKTI